MYIRRYDWKEDDRKATVYLTRHLRIRLTDPERNLLPNGRCRIVGDPTVYDFDDEGVVEILLQGWNQTSVELEWEPDEAKQNDEAYRFYWHNTFQTDIKSEDDQACKLRLAHLGFYGNELADQINEYETFLDRTPTGKLMNIRDELIEWHDDCDSSDQEPAPDSGADDKNETVDQLESRLDKAFNDPGFLGLGGTDEDEVIKVLTIARDQGLMNELKALYEKKHPDEPQLEAELEDELSGDDLKKAQALVRDGLNKS